MFKKTALILLVSLLFWFPGRQNPAAAQPLTKVTFMPLWVPQAQFAGYYVALETGIYKKYGLDVKIISGGPGRSSTTYLKNRKADFASLWLVNGITLCDQGTAVVNLAQIVQRSALMLVARKNSGILKPEDINGRKVSLWGPPFTIQPEIFFQQYNIKVIPIHQSYSVNLFLRHAVSVTSAMWYNEYHTILNAGINPDELTTFFFADHNLNFPEDGIYTRRETWEEHPDRCLAFVAASFAGWKKAFAEPDLALDITMRNLRKEHIITNRVHQKWMLEHMRKIILPHNDPEELGRLKREDFLRVAGALKELGLIKKIPDFTSFRQPPAGE